MGATRDDLHMLALVAGAAGAGTALSKPDTVRALNKFGLATEVGTSETTIWPENTRKTYRTTAAAMTISSADANDADGDNGANTVQIYGVDGDWQPVQETLTMNGQSGVTTTNSYMIVHRMVVRTAGSSNANEGIIYVGTGAIATGKPAVVECVMPAGENQSQVAFYAVPAGATLLIHDFEVFAATASKILTAHLTVKPVGGVFNHKANQILVSNAHQSTYEPPLAVAEKSIVEVIGSVNSTTGEAAARFSGVLMNLTSAQIAQL
jgi:hypothetical protein